MNLECLPDNYWEKIKITPSGCWEWQGKKSSITKKQPNRFGQIYEKERTMIVHRYIFKKVFNKNLDKYTIIKFKCNNSLCSNPLHLYCSKKENTNTKDKRKKSKYCRRGHLKTLNNTWLRPGGHRECKECKKTRNLILKNPPIKIENNSNFKKPMESEVINFTLLKHQENLLEKAKDQDAYFLMHSMGTGKTCSTLQLLRYKCFQHKRLLRTLVICPLAVTINWSREIEMFTKIPKDSVKVLKGSGKKREQQLAKAIYNPATDRNDYPGIIIVNYDALVSDSIFEQLKEWNPEVLILDEAHYLKNHKAQRAKQVEILSLKARYKYLLTGTPILNSPLDLFMPYKILDGGATLGKNFFTFRSTYFMDSNAAWAHKDNHYPKFVVNPNRVEELNKLIYQKADRVLKEDCLDLPPLVKTQRYVELSPEQKTAYLQMKKDFIAFVKDKHDQPKAVVAQLAVTKALRMQQIVCGSTSADDGTEILFKNTPRIKILKELLEEITVNNKLIVWSVFKADYRAIEAVCKELEIKYCFLTGEQSMKQKQESMDNFNTDPEMKVIISNQKAGGVGVNLIAASYSIYYSKNFSLADDLQSEARNYRKGSDIHASVTRIDLVAKDTIDELVNQVLSDKLNVAELILDYKENV